MVNPIPESVRKLWGNWNIRGVILFSLSLQTVLILFAPLRKGTGSKLIISVIWSAYLLADWAANFGVGLITERARDTPEPSMPADNNELLAFWAPFLLLHLGGPDTITAFALEDNELWLRHLFGLVFQAVAAVYIFLLSLPGNKLLFPTVLVFIAGMIKNFERIRTLHLASYDKFRDSTLRELREDQSFIVIEKDADYLDAGCQYFQFFKGIVVDLLSYFRAYEFYVGEPSFGTFGPEKALGIIEVELNLFYEVLHTKIQVIHSLLGIILRFTSLGSVVAALSIFYFRVEKHGRFNEFDVRVTYALFLGAIALDIIASFMLIFSDWTFAVLRNDDAESRFGKFRNLIVAVIRWFLILKSPRWQHSHDGGKYELLATPFLFRRWSGSVSGISVMTFWLNARPSRVHKVKSRWQLACQNVIRKLGIDRLIACTVDAIDGCIHSCGIHKIFQNIALATNKVIYFLCKIMAELGFLTEKLIALLGLGDVVILKRLKISQSHEPLLKEMWKFIFSEIEEKAHDANDAKTGNSRICSASGSCTLQKLTNARVMEITERQTENVPELPASLLLWHLVTDLLYYDNEDVSVQKTKNAREFSKILSDYMFYLLLLKPNMLNVAATFMKFTAQGLFHSSDRKISSVKEICEKIMLRDSDIEDMDNAADLAQELQKFEEDKRWELVSKVWVELLCYGAIHCRSRAHAQQVTNGGELITFVWVLMHHFDLVKPQV
ncbi:hypothetical protein CUMW_266100 [Citrus unshiu]|uniref:DUF4220 domain-containing protein n=1 Tax=Citrus unshiu TaxID=55188 RepID=A0A2H5QVP5_CITUN|nr:hypothetical protein CUMW_266100 [Citrus unshiu]